MDKTTRRKKARLPGSLYQQGYAFSVSIGTHQKHPWFALYPDLAESAVQILRETAYGRGTKLYAWCIMPDHVHMLLQDNELLGFVRLFKGRLTPKARAYDYGRPLWQRSFYDHALRREESLEEIARYIWWNPVRAGLIDHPLEYKWCGSEVWPDWREYFGEDGSTHGKGEELEIKGRG